MLEILSPRIFKYFHKFREFKFLESSENVSKITVEIAIHIVEGMAMASALSRIDNRHRNLVKNNYSNRDGV